MSQSQLDQERVVKAIAQIHRHLNADQALQARGRLVNATMILAVGEDEWMFQLRDGQATQVLKGPFVMPSYTFRISAPRDEWLRFWQPVPPPGSHDLFALLKRRVLRFEGDLHPLMANLFYFKFMLAAPRASGD